MTLVAMMLSVSLGTQPAAATGEPSAAARKLVESAFEQRRVASMRTELTITLIEGSRQWVRSAELLVRRRTDIDDDQVFRFTAPAELAGSAVLTAEHQQGDDDQWVYLPSYHTVRRIPAANRGDAYLGTDFFYEDVLDPRWEEYAFRELRREVVAGKTCVVVEAVPTSGARSSAYARTLYWVDPELKVVVRQDFFDKGGKLLKRLTHSNLRRYGRYLLWDEVAMENLQSSHKTIMKIQRRSVDVALPADTFTQRALKRG